MKWMVMGCSLYLWFLRTWVRLFPIREMAMYEFSESKSSNFGNPKWIYFWGLAAYHSSRGICRWNFWGLSKLAAHPGMLYRPSWTIFNSWMRKKFIWTYNFENTERLANIIFSQVNFPRNSRAHFPNELKPREKRMLFTVNHVLLIM